MNEEERTKEANPAIAIADMGADTAMIRVNPHTDVAVVALRHEAEKLLEYAEKRLIVTDNDLKPAVDDLSVIAKVKKALIAKKDDYVKPIKAHEDAVKAVFQTILTPLEDADRINRQKVQGYRAEQARRQAEAEAINREKLELAKREEVLTGEHTVDLTPVIAPTPVARVQTDLGSAGVRANWKWEVVDFALLPDEYKMVNAGMLTPVVKASKGKLTIPGVRIYNEEGLSVTAR